MALIDCPRCAGTGNYRHHGVCFRCHGTGRSHAVASRPVVRARTAADLRHDIARLDEVLTFGNPEHYDIAAVRAARANLVAQLAAFG